MSTGAKRVTVVAGTVPLNRKLRVAVRPAIFEFFVLSESCSAAKVTAAPCIF